MSEYLIQDDTLKGIAHAIREKAGITNNMSPEEMRAQIYMMETTTQTGAPAHGVTFYDYDGTILYSYSVKEARALTELPPAPTHDGIIFDGWTHTLEEVKAALKTLDVGAMYTSETTRFVVNMPSDLLTMQISVEASAVGGVLINWGDGSESTNTTSGFYLFSHEYMSSGSYTITLSTLSGSATIGSTSSSDIMLFGDYYTGTKYVTSAIVGNNVEIRYSDYAYLFSNCSNLKTVIICNGHSTLGGCAFRDCSLLEFVIVPNSVYSMLSELFRRCSSLKGVIWKSVSYCSSSFATFEDCVSLKRIFVPIGLNRFDSYFVSDCTALQELYIPSTNPIVNSVNYSITGYGFKIYVPVDSVPTYKSKEGFSRYKSYIYGFPF